MANTYRDRQEALTALSYAAVLPYLQEALEDMIADTSSSSPSDDENNMILCTLEAVQRNRHLSKRKPLPKTPALADIVLLV